MCVHACMHAHTHGHACICKCLHPARRLCANRCLTISPGAVHSNALAPAPLRTNSSGHSSLPLLIWTAWPKGPQPKRQQTKMQLKTACRSRSPSRRTSGGAGRWSSARQGSQVSSSSGVLAGTPVKMLITAGWPEHLEMNSQDRLLGLGRSNGRSSVPACL